MRRWLLDTAQGQIIAILVGALLATFALVAMLLMAAWPAVPPLPPGPWPGALQIAAIIEALHAAPAEDRATIAEAVSTADVRVRLGSPPACARIAPGHELRDLQLILSTLLADKVGPLSVADCAAGPGAEEAGLIELPRIGAAVSVRPGADQGFPQFVLATLPVIVAVSFLLVLVIALSLWTLWRINRPLRRLASNVETFGLDVAVAPLSERGPREIRQVAQAFNRMQQRITRSVEERKRMLMAIGHDLRTPLTRLRLRVDMEQPPATRQKLLHDLDLMQRMINGALSFLADQSDAEPAEQVDLGALVESICIEFAEAGNRVTYSGAYGSECRCQPTAITRAVSNLIENGCRYGSTVEARVSHTRDEAVIEIRDDGPGIPAEMRGAVLEPFARLDTARAAEGRLGLGLSIVQEIVRRHGGQIILADAQPSGLLVRLVLPLAGPLAPAQP